MHLFFQIILAGVIFGVGAHLPYLVVRLVTWFLNRRTRKKQAAIIDAITKMNGPMACSKEELQSAVDDLQKAIAEQTDRWADLGFRIDVAGQDFARPTPANLEHADPQALERAFLNAISRIDQDTRVVFPCMFMASLPQPLR